MTFLFNCHQSSEGIRTILNKIRIMYFKAILKVFIVTFALVECKTKRELPNHYYASPPQGENYNSHELLHNLQGSYNHNEDQGGYPIRINTINVPIPQAYPITIEKNIPVNIAVPVNRPITVEVPQPVPITVERRVPVEVKRPVPYFVRVPVHVPITQRVEVPIHRPYPFLIPRPVSVPVPRPVVIESQVPIIVNAGNEEAEEGGFEGNVGGQQEHNYKFPDGLFSIQNFHSQPFDDGKMKIQSNQLFSHS